MSSVQPLRILVAALGLDGVRGARVRELIRALRQEGHDPVVYAPLAEERSVDGVAVLDELPADAAFDVTHVMGGAMAVLVRTRLPALPMVLDPEGRSPPDVNAQGPVGEETVPLEAYRRAMATFEPRDLSLPGAEIEEIIRETRGRMAEAEGEVARRAEEAERLAMRSAKWEAIVRRGAPKRGDLGDAEISVLALLEMERKAWELQQFHDAVKRSAWYPLAMRLRAFVNALFPWGTRRRGLVNAPVRASRLLRRGGPAATLKHLLKPWRWVPNLWRPAIPEVHTRERYEVWHRRHFNRRRMRSELRDVRNLAYRPLISVVMPAYNSEPAWLRDVVGSIRKQIYDRWELCIADDASTRPETAAMLRALAGMDPRIRVRFLDRNIGISGASNAALAMATGEFVALVDHDDLLRPNALSQVVRVLNEHPDLDYVYTDEDKMDVDGRLIEPFFKPDWSPDLLLSMNYLSHLSVFRREVVERVGGFRPEYDGSQDYDLVLRITEATDRIGHIPLPLYTWRKVPGSAADSEDAKPWAYQAARRALQDALRRRRIEGTVEYGASLGAYRVRYRISGTPRVTIIIPTRDRVDLLRACIESIRPASTYQDYEILVVDNQSTDPETRRYLSSLKDRVIEHAEPFNFARMMNLAAEQADGDMLLFLNNDTRVISPDWIEALLEHAQRPEVAAAGPRLLFPDGTPQHLGVVVGPGRGLAENMAEEEDKLGASVHDCSAVTAACMMIRRDVFRELGGFEERLQVAYNDVDLCLRAREKGYLVVYTPYALLSHDEGSTRFGLPGSQPASDAELFRQRWAGYRDPYYSPNLDLDHLAAIKL